MNSSPRFATRLGRALQVAIVLAVFGALAGPGQPRGAAAPSPGRVFVARGKAATFPNTRAGAPVTTPA